MSAEMEEDRTDAAIDDDVELITEQIQALKQLGLQDEVDDDAVYDFSIRWGAALAGRLPRLVHYSQPGCSTRPMNAGFKSLCDELRGLSDLIDRIGLAQPGVHRFAARQS